MTFKEVLTKLSNAHGVSGYEGNIRDIIRDELYQYGDIQEDSFGNLILTMGYGDKHIMLDAHMDEIGLVVKNIDDKGFLKFVKLGGWYDPTLISQRVIVHGNGRYYGVIGSKPPHVMNAEEKKSPVDAKDMFIDVGAKSKEEVEKMGIEIGTPISFDQKLVDLTNDLVTGKSLDDRVGIAMLIEVAKRIDPKNKVSFVFAVQEEIGLKGSRVASYRLNPDVAIAVDTTIAGDHPNITHDNAPVDVGKGPVVVVMDGGGRGLITHPKVLSQLKRVAKDNGIPIQLEVSDGGTTDGMAIHMTRKGIPTGVVSIPTRYIHSPIEVASLKDMESGIELITQFVNSIYL